jgi:hypothetical protein
MTKALVATAGAERACSSLLRRYSFQRRRATGKTQFWRFAAPASPNGNHPLGSKSPFRIEKPAKGQRPQAA